MMTQKSDYSTVRTPPPPPLVTLAATPEFPETDKGRRPTMS
jgi:hypothetical protein